MAPSVPSAGDDRSVDELSPSERAELAAGVHAAALSAPEPSSPGRRRPSLIVAAVVVAVALAAVVLSRCAPEAPLGPLDPLPPPTSPDGDVLRDPYEDTSELWDFALLGEDAPIGVDELVAALADPSSSDLQADAFADASKVAADFVTARASMQVPPQWSSMFTPVTEALFGATGSEPCTDVSVLVSSARSVPSNAGHYARAIVLWTGSCPVPVPAPFAVTVVDLDGSSGSWTPVWSLGPVLRPAGSTPGVPQRWELESLGDCGADGNDEFYARVEVVALWSSMCDAAEADGVSLEVTSALRTAEQQADLFALALDRFGSEAEASRWVSAASPPACSSRHCAGEAIDVDLSTSARRWLFATVSCVDPSGAVSSAVDGACARAASPVPRLVSFGFTAPIGAQPHHLEPGLPLGLLAADSPSSCDPPRSQSAPQMIFSVFRCELAAAGVAPDVVDAAAADAVLVARCASGWNSGFVAFGGRFREAPNPNDGRLHDEAGLFALSQPTADRVVPGGYAAVADPVASATGAARLWLADAAAVGDGFASFDCASTLSGDRPEWLSALYQPSASD